LPISDDTELNAGGRAQPGDFKPDLKPDEFVAAVMKGLEADVPEIGYGFSAEALKASRDELNGRFQQMNARW
jgi:hypothetical protein